MDYVVYHYDYAGNLLDSLLSTPSHYRPLKSREPDNVRSAEHGEWIDS